MAKLYLRWDDVQDPPSFAPASGPFPWSGVTGAPSFVTSSGPFQWSGVTGAPSFATVESAVQDVAVGTTATTVLSVAPSAAGNYLVHTYLRVVTATTVLVQVSWADTTGAQTLTILGSGSTSGNVSVDSYTLPALVVNAATGTNIEVTATAGAASAAYISATVVKV